MSLDFIAEKTKSLRDGANRLLNTDLTTGKAVDPYPTSPNNITGKNRIKSPGLMYTTPELFFYMQFSFFKYDVSVIADIRGDRMPDPISAPARTGVAWWDSNYNRAAKDIDNARKEFKQRKIEYLERRRSQSLSIIQMPLPKNLSENYNIKFSQEEIGLLGKIVADMGVDLESIMHGNLDAWKEVGKKLVGEFPNASDKVKAVIMNNIISSTPFAGTITALRGKKLNPFYMATFEGVDLRQHNFEWTIIPESPEEMQNLERIRDAFRGHALPYFSTKGDISLMNFPDYCFIEMFPDIYPFPKACFIQSFNVNYSNEGSVFHKKGEPAIWNIQMSLIEATAITREDF